MTDGTSQGLFIVVAIVIFGIFVVLAYILFEDTLSPALASMFTDVSEQASNSLTYRGLTPTDTKFFETETLADGSIKITDYKTTLEFSDAPMDVVIPNEIDGKPVTIIGEGSFYKKGLTSVFIPNTVTKIAGYVYGGANTYKGAFADNKLKKIVIPSSVTEIGVCSFRNNILSEVVFNNGLITIQNEAFAFNNLKDVKFPNSLVDLKGYSFANNPITKLYFGNNIKSIGQNTFRGTKMVQFTIPKSVTSFGVYNFANNNNLLKINIPKHLESLFKENSPHLAKSVYDNAQGVTQVASTYSTDIVSIYD